MNVTSDKVEISVGLRVFTNDWSWGTVIEAPSEYNDGWWKVKIDDDASYCAGQTKSYNGERLTCQNPSGERDPHPVALIPVEAFLKARPWYDRKHVEEIAAHVTATDVPFCRACADWHYAGEMHSL